MKTQNPWGTLDQVKFDVATKKGYLGWNDLVNYNLHNNNGCHADLLEAMDEVANRYATGNDGYTYTLVGFGKFKKEKII